MNISNFISRYISNKTLWHCAIVLAIIPLSNISLDKKNNNDKRKRWHCICVRIAETIAGAGNRGRCGDLADLRYTQGYHRRKLSVKKIFKVVTELGINN